MKPRSCNRQSGGRIMKTIFLAVPAFIFSTQSCNKPNVSAEQIECQKALVSIERYTEKKVELDTSDPDSCRKFMKAFGPRLIEWASKETR